MVDELSCSCCGVPRRIYLVDGHDRECIWYQAEPTHTSQKWYVDQDNEVNWKRQYDMMFGFILKQNNVLRDDDFDKATSDWVMAAESQEGQTMIPCDSNRLDFTVGTEYTLGKHGEDKTVNGDGIHLRAYEMSGVFDIYVDIPKHRVDMDAWDNCARVDLWRDVTPEELLEIGLNIISIAKQELDR